MVEGIRWLLNGIIVLLGAIGVCQTDIKKQKINWIISGLSLSSILIISIVVDNEKKELFFYLLLIFIAYESVVQEKWNRKLAVFWFSCYYEAVISFPIEVLIEIIKLFLKKQCAYEKIVQNIMEIICLILLAYIIKKKENWVRWIKNVPLKYYCFGIICAFAAGGIATYIRMQLTTANRRIQILIMVLTVIVNTFLYAMGIIAAIIDSFRMHYKEESLLKGEYLHLSKMHYESLKNNIEEVRSIRHDMQAHINAVEHFIKIKDWEKLEEYIQNVQGNINKNEIPFINVNHDLVNAILAKNLSNRKDIIFRHEGLLPSNMIVEDYDLCTIFSNLMSNSIEACDKLEDREKEIILEIKSFQNKVSILIENPIQDEIQIDELGNWTSKRDRINHGYGIHNIIMSVEKYNGEITFQCKNRRFSVEIIFYNA